MPFVDTADQTPADRVATLLRAYDDYRSEVSEHYDEVFEEVSQRVKGSGVIGKADIGALTVWKRLNASTRWARDLMNTAARQARAGLSALLGFRTGDALPSAILCAAAPHRLAVYDRRSHAGLTALGLELMKAPGAMGDTWSSSGNYLRRATVGPKPVGEAGRPGALLAWSVTPARNVSMLLYDCLVAEDRRSPRGRSPSGRSERSGRAGQRLTTEAGRGSTSTGRRAPFTQVPSRSRYRPK